MKNLILPIALGLILLTGCSKEESIKPIEEQMLNTVYVMHQNGDIANFERIEVENSIEAFNSEFTISQTNSAFTGGLYEPTFRDPMLLSWSGSTDITGSHGTAELEIIMPTYTLHVKMKTECVNVVGNKAVYGGVITEVLELSGDTPIITENWRFYFQVIDNNSYRSLENQISNQWVFASPRSASLCNVYTPTHHIWSDLGYSEILIPGYVEVISN